MNEFTFTKKVLRKLQDVEIVSKGKGNIDFVHCMLQAKLSSDTVDPYDDNIEVFTFKPHRVKNVYYIRDIEDEEGNGLLMTYEDPAEGFCSEVVFISDDLFSQLIRDIEHSFGIKQYAELIRSNYGMVLDPDSDALRVIRLEDSEF